MESSRLYPTEEALLGGLRRREDAAIRQVYSLYQQRAIKKLCNRGASEPEAEDIFQEAVVVIFVNVYKPDFQLSSSLYTYMYRICMNLWLNICRQKKHNSEVRIEQIEVSISKADADEADAAFAYAEQQLKIMALLEKMKEGCREFLRLAILENKAPKEVVEILGLGSISYYYKRKSVCKDRLREMIRATTDETEF